MKRKLVGSAIGLVFVATMSTAAVAMATSGDEDGKTEHGNSQHAKKDHGKKDHAEKDHGKKDKDHGHAPPWAGHGYAGPDQDWKAAWKNLTPAQRAEKMAELAQQHADGMKKFAACVKAAGDDEAARAKCERPLPPGLAKKQAR